MGCFQKSLDFEASPESLAILSYEQRNLLHVHEETKFKFYATMSDKFV